MNEDVKHVSDKRQEHASTLNMTLPTEKKHRSYLAC